MFKKSNAVADTLSGKRRQRKRFAQSLKETAAKAVVTAGASFAVGWVLKKMLEGDVTEAAKQGAQAGAEDAPTTPGPNAKAPDAGASEVASARSSGDDWSSSDDETSPSVPAQ